MLKAILPVAVGAVLGASAVHVLTKGKVVETEPVAAIGATERLTSSRSETSSSSPADTTEAAARREAALRLLDVRGYTASTMDDIAATLPPEESVNFRIDAIVRLSDQDARGALVAAMQLPDAEQRRFALERLAQTFARRDPHSAIPERNAIDSAALERQFMASLLDNWAMTDPGRALAFLADPGDVRIPPAEYAFDLLAAHDPERLLSVADGFVADIRQVAVAAAFEALASRDARSALARIGELSPRPGKSTLEGNIAQAYGEQHPDEAWSWANERNATASKRMSVLAGIQSNDPDRALELMMAELTSVDPDRSAQMRQRVATFLFNLRESGTSDNIVTALDRILSQESSLEPNLRQFLGTWANDDPEAALEWSLRNLDRINQDQVFSNIGRSLARTSPERARQALARLPENDRAPLVTGVARTLAETSLAAAREWAFEFPRGELRDAALREYVSSEAHGGVVDTRIFGQFSNEVARGQAASDVAFRLACDGHTALAEEIVSTQIADPDLVAFTESRMEYDVGPGCGLMQ